MANDSRNDRPRTNPPGRLHRTGETAGSAGKVPPRKNDSAVEAVTREVKTLVQDIDEKYAAGQRAEEDAPPKPAGTLGGPGNFGGGRLDPRRRR